MSYGPPGGAAPPPGAPMPPSYGSQDVLMAQFRAIAQRYEISDHFAMKLKQLEAFEIVLILDDSGSMNTPLGSQPGGPFAPSITRWDELKSTVSIIVDIAAIMDKDGLDLFFLNRATLNNVTSSSQLGAVFANPPSGGTPITAVLQHVLKSKQQVMKERKLLIIIATDGAPTNQRGDVDIQGLKNVLMHERDATRCHVSFLVCTDDDQTVAYLNDWDDKLQNLDVCDDYVSERAEVLKAQGPKYNFTFGNYICKCLLGSIDPEFDNLDEVQGCKCAVQ